MATQNKGSALVCAGPAVCSLLVAAVAKAQDVAGLPAHCAGWNPQAEQSIWTAVLKQPADLIPLL
jgi:hypothetical protein